jgi:putative methionine-R-sulfoxide reductase with GAF domain
MKMNITSANENSPKIRRFGFWSNLPLASKLLLAFGALFVFAVVIAVISLLGLNRTQTAYEDTLTQGIEMRNLSNQLSINLLKARDDEKNFLLNWRGEGFKNAYTKYVIPHSDRVAIMRDNLKQLATFGAVAATASSGITTKTQYEGDISTLTQNLDIYEKSFTALVDVYNKKGFDENTDFESQFRTAASNIDSILSSGSLEGIDPIKNTFLQIRLSEKNYLADTEQSYANDIHLLISVFKDQIENSPLLTPADKTELLTQVNAYAAAFDELVELDKQIVVYNKDLFNSASAVDFLATKINRLGDILALDGITAARSNTTQTFNISIITIVLVLVLTILISITFSQQLTRPLRALTNTAKQVSSGSFEIKAEVSSTDEVGTLAQTFNSMTARLAQAFDDIRRRALDVQTLTEVSQRLSVSTSPSQLALDVVNQVQAAFNYYHAHIYYLDEITGELLMAGGTGEAGATMLARGHKIPKGQGLVGRAVATRQPVLVADVAEEFGWLPNPLLPDTKSEAAVPITAGDSVLGVLDVQQNFVNGLDAEDVSLLQSLANQIAISLKNVRSYEQAKAQADLESMVNVIGQKIQRTTTVEDTLQTAIREIGLALGAARVKANLGSSRQNDDHKASHN